MIHTRPDAPVRGTIQVPGHVLESVPDPEAIYACGVVGNCMAPDVCDGDHAVICPNSPPEVGDIVALVDKDSRCPILIKRLEMALPPDWLWENNPNSEVVGVVAIGRNDMPGKMAFIELNKLGGVHKVVHVVRGFNPENRFHYLDRDWPDIGLREGDRLNLAAEPGWQRDGLYLVELSGAWWIDDIQVCTKRGAVRKRPLSRTCNMNYRGCDSRAYCVESVVGVGCGEREAVNA